MDLETFDKIKTAGEVGKAVLWVALASIILLALLKACTGG